MSHQGEPAEGSPRNLEDVLWPDSKPEVLEALLDNHGRFLAFLERRLGDRAAAEDVLQAAFVRGIERAPRSLDAESAVHWFFRVLQNALVDHHRRTHAATRLGAGVEPALDDLATDPEAQAEACRCVLALANTLKPEYASALKRVDVEGASVQAFAGETGISANNASVRLLRARRALKERLLATCRTCLEHGCLDCTCGPKARGR